MHYLFLQILSSSHMYWSYHHLLLLAGSLNYTSLPCDTALLCLQQLIMSFKDLEEYASNIAMSIFPLILIQPKVPLFWTTLCYFLFNWKLGIFLFIILAWLSVLYVLLHNQMWRLNLKALELANELKWSLYGNLVNLSGREKVSWFSIGKLICNIPCICIHSFGNVDFKF